MNVLRCLTAGIASLPNTAWLASLLCFATGAAFAQPKMDAEHQQAVASLTMHVCLPPATPRGAPATSGQYFVVRGSQINSHGPCQLNREPWLWVERIATDYGVPVTQRGTPRSGFVVNALLSVQVGRAKPTPVNPADFEKAVRTVSSMGMRGEGSKDGSGARMPPLDFVFPPGLFPDEAGMLARGAGQAIACPGGNVMVTIPSSGPECMPASAVARMSGVRAIQELFGQ